MFSIDTDLVRYNGREISGTSEVLRKLRYRLEEVRHSISYMSGMESVSLALERCEANTNLNRNQTAVLGETLIQIGQEYDGAENTVAKNAENPASNGRWSMYGYATRVIRGNNSGSSAEVHGGQGVSESAVYRRVSWLSGSIEDMARNTKSMDEMNRLKYAIDIASVFH